MERPRHLWILGEKYQEAVDILEQILDGNPRSRAALSLLGHCFYSLQDFCNAVSVYEQLVSIYPDNNDYHLTLSQCYYNCGLYDAAMNTSSRMENMDSELQNKVLKLQTAIKFCTDELSAARSFVKRCCESDPDTYVLKGCLEFKAGKYREALEFFMSALKMVGNDNMQLEYNVALCHYLLKEFDKSFAHVGEILRHAIEHHPELGLCCNSEGVEFDSVGNTISLYKSALVEALNLKVAMEFELEKYDGARCSLLDLPPRNESELDMVTLHNTAILNMDDQPSEGFNKLRFIMEQKSFPPETFANLLLLYCKYEQYDIMADLMAKYEEYKLHLTPFLCEFFESLILKQSSPKQALKSLEEMSTKMADNLRKLVKQVKDIRALVEDMEESNKICDEYDDIMSSQYLPVIMAQGKIYWDEGNYPSVEKILMKSNEFCNETETWKLNVAHVLFMQGSVDKRNPMKIKEAATFYEAIVKENYNKLLGINAVILANLCASYILTGESEEGELLMRRLEREEEDMSDFNPHKKLFHLCIVNMVIGTLYCRSKNYCFGMSRIVSGMKPYEKRLGPDTWYYAKACLLHIIVNTVKYSFHIPEGNITKWMLFLDECASNGENVKTVIEEDSPFDSKEKLSTEFGKKTVTYEARVLKHLLIQLNDWC